MRAGVFVDSTALLDLTVWPFGLLHLFFFDEETVVCVGGGSLSDQVKHRRTLGFMPTVMYSIVPRVLKSKSLINGEL